MDRQFGKILVFLVVLLAYSCGQVGFITGGEDDEYAPKPILEDVRPPMASINVKPKEIIIPFDEFIQLNSPAKNISVVPADVTLEATVKGKTLSLKPIKGDWVDNTTYAIYLNRAVKDLNEGNDSLMIYVFATGNYIDSLTTAVRVVDAYTNKPKKSITVGLYEQELIDDTSRVSPRYVVMTDDTGLAQFSYLQKGPFYAYAFNDKNQNTRLNEGEARGKLTTIIYADTSTEVIPEIRLMAPRAAKFGVKTNSFIAPATWCLGFSKTVPEDTRIIFTNPQPEHLLWNDKKDSLTVFYAMKSRSGKVELVIENINSRDTISKKYFFKDPEKFNYTTNLEKGSLLIGDTLKIQLIEAINFIDSSQIDVMGKPLGDSVYVSITPIFSKNRADELTLYHSRVFDSIRVTLPAKTIGGANFSNPEEILLKYTVQPKSKVGTLIIKLDSIPEFGLLEVHTDKGILVKKIKLEQGVLEYNVIDLQPKTYSFRLLIDTDGDGYWSLGDIFTNQEAERVIWFDSKTQIRANWDVEVKLTLKPGEEALEPEVE
jgi:uncharacterized protein (DUF2141 family)